MASKSPPKSFPVRGRASGALEGLAGKRWRQLERVAQALRSLGNTPMTRTQAERMARRFGVHWATIYRYRARLQEADETTSVAGRTRGWKPLASRLTSKQEQGIEEAINTLRKKPGPLRVVDLVEEVSARCRLLRVPCPSRPSIDRRLKRSPGLKVHRRGVAAPG
jgi:putative transposase